MFPYRFHNAGYSQKTRKIQQCRDTSKRQCRSALSISTTAFTNALTAAHAQQMLAATQKPQDFKSIKLRICLYFCEQGLHDTHYRLGNRGIVVPLPEGTTPFSNRKRPGRGVKLTTNQHTVPRLRIDGVILPPHHMPS